MIQSISDYENWRDSQQDRPIRRPQWRIMMIRTHTKKAMAYAETCSIPKLARFNIFMTREDINLLN